MWDIDEIGTIDDNDNVALEESDSENEEALRRTRKRQERKGAQPGADWNKDFFFKDNDGENEWDWSLERAKKMVGSNTLATATTIDEKVQRRLKAKNDAQPEEGTRKAGTARQHGTTTQKAKTEPNDDVEGDIEAQERADSESEESEETARERDSEAAEESPADNNDALALHSVNAMKDRVSKKGESGTWEVIDPEETEEVQKEKKKRAFFSSVPDNLVALNFVDMGLSRPLLRAVTAMRYTHPTPIQAKTIPVALLGKDICACAKTGSGKTSAFLLPVLERLLFRPRGQTLTRVLVLLPTRELAAQCHSVGAALAQYTDITLCLVTGGMAERQQAAQLRQRPDVLLATPGRLIDHIHNTVSFGLADVEILIMDEADRLLEMGFKDELAEVVKACPRGRQTMLFSATMTDDVDDLVSLSLNHPVRVFVDGNSETASGLVQEFVRIRQNREQDRPAILLALAIRSFKESCIVFFNSKAMAQRMKIIFALMGLKAAELHGNLNQAQRLESLDKFKHGEVDFLLATDLAARGLDISGVQTVINFNMPQDFKRYIHRVGRTARAGKKGRAVTLVGEGERIVLRDIVKNSLEGVRSRTIPQPVVELYRNKLEAMTGDIDAVMQQEKEEKLLALSEREVNKADNLLKHEKEIFSRPPKTWFQSEKEKTTNKKATALAYREKFGGKAPVQKRQITRKEKKKKEAKSAIDSQTRTQLFKAARGAKKANRRKRMRMSN